MIYTTCKVKNTEAEAATYCGQEIASGVYYQIEDDERSVWATDADVETAIGTGDLVVNDGSSDLSAGDGLTYLRKLINDVDNLKGIAVDNAGIGNMRALKYDSATSKLEYGPGNMMELSFASGTHTSFHVTSRNSYEMICSFIFDGTNVLGILQQAWCVVWTKNTTADLRLYDVTNANVIAEVIGFEETAKNAINLGTISNLPADGAIFELQGQIHVQAKDLYVWSHTLRW